MKKYTLEGPMNRTLIAKLAALVMALLLFALPAALSEAADAPIEAEAADASVEAEVVCEPVDEIAPELEADPLAGPGMAAGDTGLWIGDDSAAPAFEALEETDLPTEEGEAVPELAEVLSEAWTEAGYAAVADGAPVYADAGMQRRLGAFPKGAVVRVDDWTDDGALLKVRFDTAEARSWAADAPTGYVLAEDTLRLTEDEEKSLVASMKADAGNRGLIPFATLAAEDSGVSAGEETEAGETVQGLAVAQRSMADIQAFVNAHPSGIGANPAYPTYYNAQTNLYAVAATDDPYTIGKLSSVNQQSALNLLNQLRYIAGLDANLALLPEREEMEAATALVLKLVGGLDHSPDRPEALAGSAYDNLYYDGFTGAGRSNIAKGFTVTGAILAYMDDNDSQVNISEVGHRRWILNPRMGRTIAGANGRYNAMYAHDTSNSAASQTRVAWPAQQMPVQYFNSKAPWSVSFGTVLEADQIEVDLVRQWDGRTWHFSSNQADGDFYVNNQGFGQRGCVIFRPDNLDIMIDDTFNVSITDNAAGTVTRYSVHFFSLDMSASASLSHPAKLTAVKTDKGNKITWSAVERATGYYVLRSKVRSVTTYGEDYFPIIADVKGETSFTDTNVDPDTEYYYKVYPHTACLTCARTSSYVTPVAPQPDSVSLSPSGTVKLYEGDTLQLKLTLKPSYAETGVFWNSTSEWVGTVTQKGLFTALEKGVTTVSVTTDNNLIKKVKIQVMARTSIKNAKITVSNKTYTGKALKPAVKVKLGTKVLTQGADADYTLKYTNNTAVGTATVKITGKNKYKGTATATFKIKPKKVTGLKLTAGKKKLTASWKKVSGVTGYQLQYATSTKKLSAAKKLTVKGSKTLKYVIKKLKTKKTYYVRIRSYKTVNGKKYYSSWSEAVKKKTK